MKKILILASLLLTFGFANSQDFNGNDEQTIESNLKFSDLTEIEKQKPLNL